MSSSTPVMTVVKLVVVSLVVGYVISALDITPEDVLNNFGETIYSLYNFGARAVKWAAEYVILGAIIVIPIWGIAALLNYLNRKKKS